MRTSIPIAAGIAGLLALVGGVDQGRAHPGGSHAGGPPAQVGAEFSGQWYNPAQSGHGLLLEVLPDGRAVGAWFVFDDAGNPFWIVGTGRTEGPEMGLEMESLSGGHFPPHFRMSDVERTAWGHLTIRFEDCSNATLTWDSDLPAFGSGSMAIQRLTSIEGLPCGETAKWRSDLDALAETVRTAHPDPFYRMPQASFEARVAALRERLANIPADQVPVAFAELLAGLGDAHTTIFLQGEAMGRFPLELTRVREGLIVTAAHDGYRSQLGRRLVSIDGVPVEMIESSLARIIAHENQSWLEALAPEYILIPEVLAYLGHVGSPHRAAFQFQSRSGEMFEQVIEAEPPNASLRMHSAFMREGNMAPMHLSRDDNYWFEYMEETRSLYLAYHRAQQIHGMPFEDMLHQMEMFVQQHAVDRLILDLRLNRGGNSSIIQPLIDGLQNSPFNHPDTLFVLIGRNTFSSGLLNALQLRDMTHATLVCRPTGGKPDHFGETRSLMLEHTGLRVTYSTRYFDVIHDDSVSSLEPDIRVDDPLWRDLLQGDDPCIRAAGGS